MLEKARPFFQLLPKLTTFHWNESYEEAFQDFKKSLASPSIMAKSIEGHDLCLYLTVSEHAIRVVVMQEQGKCQDPMYCISKKLELAGKMIAWSVDKQVKHISREDNTHVNTFSKLSPTKTSQH
ncbi:hypothetical protein CR513_10120, partial [Mucuna pruriens]